MAEDNPKEPVEHKATTGKDTMQGTPDTVDRFSFMTHDRVPGAKNNTLDNGDEIKDYENGDIIEIDGVKLTGQQVDLKYDGKTNTTFLEFDFDGDGKPERTITLEGDKRGEVHLSPPCCGSNATEITIDLSKAADGDDIVLPDMQDATHIDLENIDFLEGAGGADIMFGLAGNDTIFGGSGPDTIVGGDDNDRILGGGGPDTLHGERGDDELDGGDNDDGLYGGLGNDTLEGRFGKDYLSGDEGDDILNGGEDNDRIKGGQGADTSLGGTGDDTFVYSPGDIADGEKIGDYEYGEKIDIGGVSDPSRVRLTPNADGSKLELDLDGDGKFESSIQLDGVEGGRVILEPNDGGLRILEAEDGNDSAQRFSAPSGGIFVDGRGGFDSVRVDASINDVRAVHDETTGRYHLYGTDAIAATVVQNVEQVVFNDGVLRLDTAGGDGLSGQVYRLYQAAFDRTPDNDGLAYWVDQADDGLDIRSMANFFVGSAEFVRLYGADISDRAFTSALYDNVLNRAPDDAGFDYWVGELQNNLSRREMLVLFSDSPENVANTECATCGGIWIAA